MKNNTVIDYDYLKRYNLTIIINITKLMFIISVCFRIFQFSFKYQNLTKLKSPNQIITFFFH